MTRSANLYAFSFSQVSETKLHEVDEKLDESNTAGLLKETYTLQGIVYHKGININSGHYTCAMKKENERLFSFDDAKVTKLLNLPLYYPPRSPRLPYILLYVKMSSSDANVPCLSTTYSPPLSIDLDNSDCQLSSTSRTKHDIGGCKQKEKRYHQDGDEKYSGDIHKNVPKKTS